MARFEAHIAQAKANLDFLALVNHTDATCYDWQVTVAFYAAVHLINAHISQKLNMHFRTHVDVDHVLNPFNRIASPAALPEREYLAYKKLNGLSRRARYLVHEDKPEDKEVRFTYSKHLAKAVRHLDILMQYVAKLHAENFSTLSFSCIELRADSGDLSYFSVS